METKLIVASTAGVAAGAALYALANKLSSRKGQVLAATTAPAPVQFAAPAEVAECMSLAAGGTMLLCTQNLAEGHLWRGNVVLLSPSSGPFAKEFAELGVAVWIGELDELLRRVTDVRLAICNTIMTAHLVCALADVRIPSMWILHEWWPGDMLVTELTKRNDKNTTPEIVRKALDVCPHTVCVCKAQRDLYRPTHGVVTYVGVPEPAPDWKVGKMSATPPAAKPASSVTFLCLGIVCPRKNQHFSVEIFKKWAGKRTDVRLLVVGARYVRQYEIDYVDKVKATIAGDPRIELYDVTNDVDQYYRQADALLFTSLNEVTPMVIAEAMMRSLPVVTTDIAGIPEMLQNGVHGFAHPPETIGPFVEALEHLGGLPVADSQRRRLQMGAAARKHAIETFTNAIMVSQYRGAALKLSPPVVLVDMDGCLVDWDAGFMAAWRGRSPIIRSLSYSMEECVPSTHRDECLELYHSAGFFRSLPPMAGGVEAVRALAAAGYRVFLCTAPVTTSEHCAGEKFEWVREHLGPEWVPRIILTSDKTFVRGDVLIDDKPKITGAHHPTWQQLLFSAPYNTKLAPRARLDTWTDAAHVVATVNSLLCAGPTVGLGPTGSISALEPPAEPESLKAQVAALPDFSHLLPEAYRKDYAAWRSGQPKGASGELGDALTRMEAMQDSVLNNMSEEFTEVSLYRQGYASWRRGRSSGAKSFHHIGAFVAD